LEGKLLQLLSLNWLDLYDTSNHRPYKKAADDQRLAGAANLSGKLHEFDTLFG
jgi:hypothetical protein